MEKISVTFNNGIVKEYDKGITYYEVSKDYKLSNEIIGVKVNNQIIPLDRKIDASKTVNFFDLTDLAGYKMYQAGLKFIFELALFKYAPNLKVSFEHSVPKGILAHINGETELLNEDIKAIKGIMASIIDSDLRFEKFNVLKKEAYNYYVENGDLVKAKNIQNTTAEIVSLYRLDNLLNYFYIEMPYSTKAISKFDIINLGHNRLVFLMPSIRSNGNIPEYVHYGNIIDSYFQGKSWLLKMGMRYLPNMNDAIACGNIKDFINSNELLLNESISKVANDIYEQPDKKVILVAGPSSSAKTTATSRLASYLKVKGLDPVVISVDNYIVNREDSPRDSKGNYDWECIEAIDLKLFNDDLEKLLSGHTINMPEYNFVTGKRVQTNKFINLKENSILLIEGLHALNDDMTPRIPSKYKYKIYLSPFIPLNIDDYNYISSVDLRLIRRIIRDNLARGRSVESTIDKWQSVRDGEEKYIFPYIHQADIIINTALTYEIGVLKGFIMPLLYSVDLNSKHYEEARRLICFLDKFYTIPSEYVGKDSILREFIGGN